MDIYIINLPSQTKRKEHMIKLMQNMSVSNYQFVAPKVIEEDTNLNKIKKAELSLLETNIDIFDKILVSSNPPLYVLVFEDDIKPTIPENEIMSKIYKLINEVPEDWDMIYLEYCGENCLFNKKISEDISKASGPLCTAAILYNAKNLHKIIRILQKKYSKNAIDKIYLKQIKNNYINAYISTPPLFVQDTNTFETTINPYYIIRSIYGYRSCNTYMILNIIILLIIITTAVYLILILN
jgi:GR25 family glycosyltransferase involved in LPS biosynthesis